MQIKELLMEASLEQAADYFIRETQSDPLIKTQIISSYKEFQNEISKRTPVGSGMVLLAWSHICDERRCLHNGIYMREELLSADVSLVYIEDVAGLSDDEVASAINKAIPLYGESAALMDWDEALGGGGISSG